MSFGFGIGDFLAIGQLALDVYNQCRGCSGHYRDLASNAGQLALTLSNLKDLVKKRRLDAAQQTQLLEHGEKCKEVLLAIQEVLREYESLSTKSKKIQDMLGWDYEGARELRDRLTASVVMLSNFYDTLTLSSMFRLEDALKRMMRQVQAGQKGADAISILSSRSVESIKTPQAWRLIIQDLEDLGISPEYAQKHRDFIVQWFMDALRDVQAVSLNSSGSDPTFPRNLEASHKPSHVISEPLIAAQRATAPQVEVKPRQRGRSKFSIFKRRGIFGQGSSSNATHEMKTGDNIAHQQLRDPDNSIFDESYGLNCYDQDPAKVGLDLVMIAAEHRGFRSEGLNPVSELFSDPENDTPIYPEDSISNHSAEGEGRFESLRPGPTIRNAPTKSQGLVDLAPDVPVRTFWYGTGTYPSYEPSMVSADVLSHRQLWEDEGEHQPWLYRSCSDDNLAAVTTPISDQEIWHHEQALEESSSAQQALREMH